MGAIRTLGLATAVKGTPTPAVLAAAYYTSSNLATPGVVIGAASFYILNGIATIVLGSTLPAIGYNGPNGYPNMEPTQPNGHFDIYGGITGGTAGNAGPAGGQQVTLWGFTTATYFNGCTVTVLDCDPSNGSFRFYFTHANVGSPSSPTSDTGHTAACPFQHYRVVRIECDQANGTDIVYVGDLNVSTTRYVAALSLAGQLAIEIASDNIPADRIWMVATNSSATDVVHVSLIY